jgi:hypothetical protein
MWNLAGTPAQNALVQQALDRCDFDFRKCLPSLAREGKTAVRVEWADLSRYSAVAYKPTGDHSHVHDGDAVAHPIEREVDGRMRVLGLFYLPPYTKIVLDLGLERTPLLAQEVFLAEGAHCADYQYMTREHRRRVVNAMHRDQLPPGADTADGIAFNLDGHTCSWFDVNTYAWWCGESMMQMFIEGTSDIPCTIRLAHPVGPEDRAVVREILGIVAPEPTSPTPDAPFPDEPVAPVPPVAPEPDLRVYRAKPNSKVVHDAHRGLEPVEWFDSLADAQAAGLRACKTCRPA